MKRIEKVWAKRYHRGYIIWVPRLLENLTGTTFVQFKGVTVTTKDLRDVLKSSVRTEDCLFRVNGGLQVEEIRRYAMANPDVPGTRVIAHRMVSNAYIHKIESRNVEKHNSRLILVLKPRIYGGKEVRQRN